MAKINSVEHARIDCGEVTLHCALAGDPGRPLVVLLHGFPESWYSWRHQIPALARHFRVAAPSLRGYGESDRPKEVAAYVLPKLTGDVRGLIRGLGYEDAAVVGHDWGGGIAWAFAIDHPDACRKLAVCNCPHPAVFQRALLSNPRQLLRSWYMFLFQIPYLPEWLFTRSNMRALDRAFRSMVVRKDREVFSDDDLAEIKRAFDPPGAMTAAINYYRAQFRDRANLARYSAATRIQCPTLLIWAEDDVALGKELTYGMEPLFEAPLGVRYLPQCSHWVQQERPEEVNRYLLEFLRPE
ncbi:MAG: alpha/beta hydrolase [Thermodesulfobacteriota bacterium]